MRISLRKRAARPHVGIELRISNVNGELVRADSDHLYYSAKYGECSQCSPACLPHCDRHGWLELIPGLEGMYAYSHDMPMSARIRIEVRPRMLYR